MMTASLSYSLSLSYTDHIQLSAFSVSKDQLQLSPVGYFKLACINERASITVFSKFYQRDVSVHTLG